MAERIEVTMLCRWCGVSVSIGARKPRTGEPILWVHSMGGYRACFSTELGRQAEPTRWKKVAQ